MRQIAREAHRARNRPDPPCPQPLGATWSPASWWVDGRSSCGASSCGWSSVCTPLWFCLMGGPHLGLPPFQRSARHGHAWWGGGPQLASPFARSWRWGWRPTSTVCRATRTVFRLDGRRELSGLEDSLRNLLVGVEASRASGWSSGPGGDAGLDPSGSAPCACRMERSIGLPGPRRSRRCSRTNL